MKNEREINFIRNPQTTLAKVQFEMSDTLKQIKELISAQKITRGSVFLGTFNSVDELPKVGDGIQVGDWALVDGDMYYVKL